MKILMLSTEIFPLAKTGGLADVVGSLSTALARLGAQVTLVMPAYREALKGSRFQKAGREIEVTVGNRRERGQILKTKIPGGLTAYLIRADRYFDRDGLYGTAHGDYPDNAERFTFFGKAALELARRWAPVEIIHCHDWQASLVPVLKKLQSHLWPELHHAKTVLTIHNLAYQGNFPPAAWDLLNLDWHYFSPRYLEFYGNFSFLKGGILFADALTTVSKKYSTEIKTPEYGYGLDGVIRDREKNLYGILNGADYREWNPETDPHIKRNYGVRNLRGKASCKKELQEIFHLPVNGSVPLIGIVSRLVHQKGLDILVEALEELMHQDVQLVVLGTGEERYERPLAALADFYRTRLAIKIGYDNVLAHKIEAGADIFLMPSRYEPCGLNQIYSLKYGTIPIVRATGGLDDTVEDYQPLTGRGNGFKFSAYSGAMLLETVKQATAVYSHKKAWRHLIANAMACDFSWRKSATEYLALYRRLLEPAA